MSPELNVNLDILRKLHRIHRQLSELNQRLARGPKQLAARQANVDRQEELLAQIQAEAKAFRIDTDAKQLQFKASEQKTRELRVKLNQATSNREYQALKDQIAAAEMANSVLADEILEALDKVDGYHAKLAEAATAAAKTREETEQARQEIGQREPAIRSDVERLEAELLQCEESLPPEVRDPYQRIVRQRGEDAMAPVLDGRFCTGCNQQVPLNMYEALRQNRPVFCKSCGRLLYIAEGQDVVPPRWTDGD